MIKIMDQLIHPPMIYIEDPSNVFLTSDPHFWHKNVITYCDRPFTNNLSTLLMNKPDATEVEKGAAIQLDVAEMNEMLIKNWNEVVPYNARVICLGDFSMAARGVELITKRLNGIKDLVAGNHDFVHPYHDKSKNQDNHDKWVAQYKAWGWNEIYLNVKLNVVGHKTYLLNHLPYSARDAKDNKHDPYRAKDEGLSLLCGHVHQRWALAEQGNMFNVGVDVRSLKPICLADILKVF